LYDEAVKTIDEILKILFLVYFFYKGGPLHKLPLSDAGRPIDAGRSL
jgi:hypothetical protein